MKWVEIQILDFLTHKFMSSPLSSLVSNISSFPILSSQFMPGVGIMVRVVGFGSSGPEFKSHSAVELIPGGVNSACHLSEVGKMSASMLVYCVGVETCLGLCPIVKETAKAAPTLCKEYGPNLLLLSQQMKEALHLRCEIRAVSGHILSI